jgi:hypothetical protein
MFPKFNSGDILVVKFGSFQHKLSENICNLIAVGAQYTATTSGGNTSTQAVPIDGMPDFDIDED